MAMSLLECKSGCVGLACQVRHVPCAWISEAGQGDSIVIAMQQNPLWQLNPEVRDSVFGYSAWLALLGSVKTIELSGAHAGVISGCYEDKAPQFA